MLLVSVYRMVLFSFEGNSSVKILCSGQSRDLNYTVFGELKHINIYRGADKFLARPGRKQATATEDFEFHMSYL